MDSKSHLADDEDRGLASRIAERAALSRPDVLIAGLFLLFAVAFNLYRLYPEVAIRAPLLNDGVLHRLALERASAALVAGEDPTD
ncbi:MAG: hypothetical protein PVG56_00320, partial [Anaerolineae bacterium]